MKRVFLIAMKSIIVTAAVNFSSTALADFYFVKKGETLSKISHSQIPGPVWGNTGSLKKIMSFNPEIKNPHWIYPGQKIRVSDKNIQRVLAGSPADLVSADVVSSDSIPPDLNSDESGFLAHTSFSVSPLVSYTRIDSTDLLRKSDAHLLSDLNFGLSLAWTQLWTSRVRTWEEVSLLMLNISQASKKSLLNSTQFDSSFVLGTEYDLATWLTVRGSLSLAQELFLRSVDANTISIDKVLVPEVTLVGRFHLFQVGSLSLGVDTQFKLYIPTQTDTYTTRLGQSLGGRVYVQQQLKNMGLELGIGYVQSNLDSSIATQSRKDILLDVKIHFGIK